LRKKRPWKKPLLEESWMLQHPQKITVVAQSKNLPKVDFQMHEIDETNKYFFYLVVSMAPRDFDGKRPVCCSSSMLSFTDIYIK
jgi:hypothetical protein